MLSFCLFYFHTEHIMSNTRLEESQTRIKIARRNINNLRYTDDTTLRAENEELESLLMKVKEESEKVENGAVADFLFQGSKITEHGDCSHEINRLQLFGRKTMTKTRQCIKKQRHHFADKSPHGQNYGFSSSHVWI